MPATIATLAEILESVETDLPDGVLRRYLNEAEVAVRTQLTTRELATLPVVVWTGRYTPALGGFCRPDVALLDSRVPLGEIRGDGCLELGDSACSLRNTDALDTDGGSGTIKPMTADGTFVTTGAVVVTIDQHGHGSDAGCHCHDGGPYDHPDSGPADAGASGGLRERGSGLGRVGGDQ